MPTTRARPVPGTPRVISPSPTPSESSAAGSKEYFGPITRSAGKSPRVASPRGQQRAGEDGDSSSDSEGRARSRSRDRNLALKRRRLSGLTTLDGTITNGRGTKTAPAGAKMVQMNGGNGHLSPASAAKNYWRELSRSPSPLGLIPIHRQFRSFVHRHEIPRKALHVSIGFLTLGLYATGYSTYDIPPVLMTFLVPIALTDVLRHNWPPFNRFYIRCLGAFMRESEAHEKYNGVIWYLLGAWTALRFFPKDVGVVSVLLLSWCDTAASTFGRLYGRYTPRIRTGKSLAGTLAACTVGVITSVMFWGVVGPYYEQCGIADNTGINAFAFQGALTLPTAVRNLLGWTAAQATVTRTTALGIMSLVAGVVASASEAIDLFGWDDNLTIPVLCGVGLYGFLRTFGSA